MVRKHIWKCLSLSLVAFLIAAWIANFFGQFGIGTRCGQFDYHYTFRSGMLSLSKHDNGMLQGIFWGSNSPNGYSSLYAQLAFFNYGTDQWAIEVPILLLITALIPVVVGTFTQFRFRLWQFFAFIAILSLELALFLRWR